MAGGIEEDPAVLSEASEPKSWLRIHAANIKAMVKLTNQAVLLQDIGTDVSLSRSRQASLLRSSRT
jgi:hypothetical protein